MTNFRIQCKFRHFTPWVVIYQTSNSVDLINTFKYLTETNNGDYHYRCSTLLGGRWCKIIPELISLFHVEH